MSLFAQWPPKAKRRRWHRAATPQAPLLIQRTAKFGNEIPIWLDPFDLPYRTGRVFASPLWWVLAAALGYSHGFILVVSVDRFVDRVAG